MEGWEQLIEHHIREYESRQKHMDELLERAEKEVEDRPELKGDLSAIKSKHDEMVDSVADFKQGKVDKHAVEAIETAGPMGVWFGLISELETLIEGLEK